MDGLERLTITEPAPGGALLLVAGELDAYTAPSLDDAILASPAAGDLHLDFSGVSFIDSTGIRVLVRADNDHRASGSRLVIVDPSPAVVRILELTSLDGHLEIESSS